MSRPFNARYLAEALAAMESARHAVTASWSADAERLDELLDGLAFIQIATDALKQIKLSEDEPTDGGEIRELAGALASKGRPQ